MFSELRPVGNKIHYKCTPFNELFHPYKSKFYQSGTAALASAIIAVKNLHPEIKHPEILLPAYACPDLISAIIFANIKPVLIDFEEHKPWMDIEKVKKNLSNSTIAVIAVNFLGLPERIPLINDVVGGLAIKVIEDSAQSLPLLIDSNYWKGDVIITSFGRGKPLSLLGGGVALTNEQDLYVQLPKTKIVELSWLMAVKYQFKIHLYNFMIKSHIYYWLLKLPGLQIGKTKYKKLSSLEGFHTKILSLITKNYQEYKKLKNAGTRIQKMLEEINSPHIIDIPKICNHDLSNPLLRYPVLITNESFRTQVLSILNQHGLGISSMYGDILPNIEGVKLEKNYKIDEFYNAKKFSEQLVTFPTHCDVTDSDISNMKNHIENISA